MDVLILLVSLGVLTAGAELLVRSSSIVALRAGVSALFVGLTIVGFGTSSPEMAASMKGTFDGNMGVSVGNVVGSNIFNVAVILALTAAIKPIRVGLSAVKRDLGVAIFASLVLFLPMALGGVIPRWLGALMFLGIVAYVGTAYFQDRSAKPKDQALAEHEVRSSLSLEEPPKPTHAWYDSTPAHIVLIVIGLALLVAGASWFVDSAVALAKSFDVPDDVIGLTIVSAGTSMPELVTSIVAARRGNPDIAVGNVIGSNIFNIFAIAGACAMVAPQTVSNEMLYVDIPIMLLSTAILVPLMKTGNQISRLEGWALLLGYGGYLTYLLVARTNAFG
jgi:cation:H+ antiporter